MDCPPHDGLLAVFCAMKMKAVNYLGGIPFMLSTKPDGSGLSINKNRIVEAIIIAVLTSAGTSYITMKQMEVKLEMFQAMSKQRNEKQDKDIERHEENISRLEEYIIKLHENGSIGRMGRK